MKDTERLRLLCQDSEAFKAGIEVGRKEAMRLVKKMREAQKEWEADLTNDYDEHWGKSFAKDKLESEVDELIKEMEV